MSLLTKDTTPIPLLCLSKTHGAQAVIPPRSNRKEMWDYDHELYKERNLVERYFQELKHYRCIATRYERLGRNYFAMLLLVSIVIWLP